MMKKVFILVEGPTEELFVKDVLRVELRGLQLIPKRLGGTVRYHEFRKQARLYLRDSSADLVTTMLDFQGLHGDFPGRQAPEARNPRERVELVEAAMRMDVNDERYMPFLMLHEFEALLFSRPEAIAEVLGKPILIKYLQSIRKAYPATPEDINDSPGTSPSARIETLCESLCGSKRVFAKATDGVKIAQKIGLSAMRAQCPHFDDWVRKLEAAAREGDL